jgi:hypothetical protein
VREGYGLKRDSYSRHVRAGIAASLGTMPDVEEPAPQSLMAALADLERRLRDAERDRLYAEVDRRVVELLRLARRRGTAETSLRSSSSVHER